MITIAYIHKGTAVGFDETGTLRYNGPLEGMPECRCVVKGDTARRMVEESRSPQTRITERRGDVMVSKPV